ncbi:MAG: ABC transporter substrate-binding protein [Spirochaetota bacterium]
MRKIILVILLLSAWFACKAEKPEQAKSVAPVRLLVIAGPSIKTAQVVQSQLKKMDVPVEIVEKKDYSSFLKVLETGDYDLALSGWTTVTGNPDYAVYSLFHSSGDYNNNGLNDPALDTYLETGRSAKIGSEEFLDAYYNVEKIVNETPYLIPISYGKRTLAYNQALETPIFNKSRSFPLETVSWRAASGKDNETDPVRVRHHTINLTSFDPAKANDGTVFSLNTNIYARLVNLDPEDRIVAGLAEAYDSEDQRNFYFALRSGLQFSNGDPIEISDIAFSLLRAANPELPGNRVYSVQGNIAAVKPATWEDIPLSVQQNLTAQLADASKRQLVRIETKNPYGQLYNMLAHTSGAIVSQSAVEAQGDAYGTIKNATRLVVSGPYNVRAVDEANNEIILVRNDNYYEAAPMKTIIFKVVPDSSAALLALEAGDVDYLYTIPTDSWQRIRDNEKLGLVVRSSNAMSYISLNLKPSNVRMSNPLFRKALYFAIDPLEIIQFVDQGEAALAASPLTPVLEGTEAGIKYQRPPADLQKAQEFLKQYQAESAANG